MPAGIHQSVYSGTAAKDVSGTAAKDVIRDRG
jgi:hypothetical protein